MFGMTMVLSPDLNGMRTLRTIFRSVVILLRLLVRIIWVPAIARMN